MGKYEESIYEKDTKRRISRSNNNGLSSRWGGTFWTDLHYFAWEKNKVK